MPEFFSESLPKARNDRKCCECGRKIPKGMIYWKCNGKWDGEMSTYSQHIECRDACYAFQVENMDCIPFSCLFEELSERGKTWTTDYYGDRINKMNLRCELDKKMRSLAAQGIKASRLKTIEQIAAYNIKHKDRHV